ncbi:NYN domain-containing protein [Novosphingopyxis sp.]|uniref:NYN domain-containing protein n=1 Tax=Novosphingopyxis sp. TaxID=2709690 RepID=UPI003B59F1D5
MLQTAIFVDAGYVYAQGAVALGQPKTERRSLRLNPSAITAKLKELAHSTESNGRLLRIYWYDGLARGSAMNFDQEAISRTEGVKCRFGTINTYGQQKGVDSLIVTDIIELARIQAISDALVLSGDEDVRVGVQVAQTFGVRVHLLGIHPAKGSQSISLVAEADTHHEWGKDVVEQWLTILPEQSEPAYVAAADAGENWIPTFAAKRVASLSPTEAQEILDYAAANGNQLPRDFDRPTLASAGHVLGRDATPKERKELRAQLRAALEKRAIADC